MRDDGTVRDSGTVAEDDFWASILKETMSEAESRMGISQPPKDDWDALLDEAMAEAESRMGVSAGSGPLTICRGRRLLDTYRVESDMIGKGGMGAVWKVRHEGWNTDLAMKRPKPSAFQTEKQKQDFIRECESWINLGLHPNIVSCYYVREIDGTPTIFSEWMAGGDLETHINKGTLYEGADAEVRERLLDVAVQFARGLRYAHENGLVHQDVKPDNLLLTKDWEAKVSDFGIARARSLLSISEETPTEPETDSNVTQMAPGGAMTPAYCSPEQAERKLLTRRTDIYSWAVSVLEMYLGSKPWAHGSQRTGPVAGLLCRDYFAMCEERPIPEALRELLAKCLEQEPDDRPHDFGEVEAALTQIYKTETGADYPRPEPKAAADTADSLNNRALSFLDLGKTEEAEKCWELAVEKEPAHLAALCNHGLYLCRIGKDRYEELLRLCDNASGTGGGEKSAQGQRLHTQIETEMRDALCRRLSDCAINSNVKLTADGQRLFLAGDRLSCWQVDPWRRVYIDGEAIRYTRDAYLGEISLLVDFLLLTPDEKLLLLHQRSPYYRDSQTGELGKYDEETKLCVVSAESGKTLRRLSGHTGRIAAVCAHPDSVHCYTAGMDDALIRWDMTNGSCVRKTEVNGSSYGPAGLSVSPDGKLLCGFLVNTLSIWDADSLRLLRRKDLSGTDAARTTGLLFSADGKEIISCGQYGLAVWDAQTLEHEIRWSGLSLKKMQLSSDGSRLLAADIYGRIMCWDAQTYEIRDRLFSGPYQNALCFDATPDFTSVAAGTTGEELVIWDRGVHIQYAPWELSRIENYREVYDRELAEKRMKDQIASALESGQIDRAVTLLEQAEREYEPYRFYPLRCQIARFCTRGALTGVYETRLPGSVYRKAEYLDISETQFDPRDGAFAFRMKTDGGQVFVREAEIGGAPKQMPFPEEYTECRFNESKITYSRSGAYMAVIGREAYYLLDASCQVRRILPEERSIVQNVKAAFSPDERYFIAAGNSKELGVWDVWTGKRFNTIHIADYHYRDFVFLGDGRTLAVLWNELLELYDIFSGERKETVKLDESCFRLKLSDDERTLFLFTSQGLLYWDVYRRRVTGAFRPELGASVTDAALSPDDTLYAAEAGNEITLWSLHDRDRAGTAAHCALMRYPSPAENVKRKHLEFSPDGSRLVIRDWPLYCLVFRWELRFPGWTDWDARADGPVRRFETCFPDPSEEQKEMFLRELENRGLGYIRRESVLARIAEDKRLPDDYDEEWERLLAEAGEIGIRARDADRKRRK